MSFDPVTPAEILEWHRRNGGFGGRPASHALRMLRECVELCVTTGASEKEIAEAVVREINKAEARGEFQTPSSMRQATEELVDVKILWEVFRAYFVSAVDFENVLRRKLDVCNERQWEPDADGVLWRPGTVTAGSSHVEPKSS